MSSLSGRLHHQEYYIARKMLKANSIRRRLALMKNASVKPSLSTSRFYSNDFKEVKSESPADKKIDPELEAMIKNDQADLDTDEQKDQETKATGMLEFFFRSYGTSSFLMFLEAPDVLIPENETVTGEAVTKEFQAETKKILDIVARSLYSDKEIFIRGMVF